MGPTRASSPPGWRGGVAALRRCRSDGGGAVVCVGAVPDDRVARTSGPERGDLGDIHDALAADDVPLRNAPIESIGELHEVAVEVHLMNTTVERQELGQPVVHADRAAVDADDPDESRHRGASSVRGKGQYEDLLVRGPDGVRYRRSKRAAHLVQVDIVGKRELDRG